MCPLCIATATQVVMSAASTGIAAIVARKFRTKVGAERSAVPAVSLGTETEAGAGERRR